MSYVENVLRRRQEAKEAWRPRYNPLEDVGEQLMAIDEAMYERAKSEEEKKRAAERYGLEKEKYGLEKERIVAETKKLQTDRTASEEALAAQRRAWEAAAKAREEELRARTAAQRDEARAAEQERARKEVIEKGFGMMRGAGLPGPGATPVSKADLDELGATVGMTGDQVLAGIEEIEAEREKMGAGLGLVQAKMEKEKAAAAALERRGRGGGGAKAPKIKTPEEIENAKEELAYKRLRNKRLERALSEKGGFVPTEEQVNKLQDARKLIQQARASTNVLRQLMNEFPDFKSYVGPVDGLITKVKAKFGANSQEASKIKSTIDRVFQAYKVATTGAAAGELEMEDLKNIMPKDTDKFETILGKLDSSDLIAQTIVDQIDLVLDKMDIRAADALARGQVPAGAAAPAAPVKKKPSKDVQADIDKFGLED